MHKHVVQKIKAILLELDCEYFEFLLQATNTSAASYLFRNNNNRKSDESETFGANFSFFINFRVNS